MYSSGSSTPDLGYYKLPPIITTEADREFLNEVNAFIDSELEKINQLDEEQRYLVYKTVFNKVIEHVTAYKPVLVQIKKEYEDTIDTIKKGQREATFLQEKLKAMASEPSTLRNYRKRGDELEERIAILRKKNDQLQQELQQIQLVKEEKEKRPKTAEKPERELKKDSRLIPGLSIEESTDMKVLQKKYETLDRQLKELSLSLRARFLPKTHKLQLKESLDNKVTYRDQLLWQSQVYKARGQKLKIALEAAQAYNQMKPPHQTVGDAVTIAFQHALGMMKTEREKTEGEQADTAQTSTFEDDDPNKEKEAEMMLEYIEKFNELFEDGLFEEAAVHAANSPKGILRTQATLAKFRDVKIKTKGRSPLLAFCDSIMSSVKAAGSGPNEALSMDCMQACLNENRLDLAYHWLSQDRLTQSVGLGKIISDHCSCPFPCKCGCQALAQSVFARLKRYEDVVLTMLKQGKSQGALQYVRQRQCITNDNVSTVLSEVCNLSIVTGLLQKDSNGKKCLPDLNFGSVLQAIVDLDKTEMVSSLIQMMLQPPPMDGDSTSALMSLQEAVVQDTTSSADPDQWLLPVLEALGTAGFQDSMYQLLAMTFVVDVVQQAWNTRQADDDDDDEEEEEEKEEEEEEQHTEGGGGGGAVSFSEDLTAGGGGSYEGSSNSDGAGGDDEKVGEDARESSVALSSRSRDDTNTSMDHSSRETSPDVAGPRGQVGVKVESILKKKHRERQAEQQPGISSSDCSPRKSPPVVRKRVTKMARKKGRGAAHAGHSSDDDEGNDDSHSDTADGDKNKEKSAGKRRVRMNLTASKAEPKKADEEEGRSKSKVSFDENTTRAIIKPTQDKQSGGTEVGKDSVEMGNNTPPLQTHHTNENESLQTTVKKITKKSGVRFEEPTKEEEEEKALVDSQLNQMEATGSNTAAAEMVCVKEKSGDTLVGVDQEVTTEAASVGNVSESQGNVKPDTDTIDSSVHGDCLKNGTDVAEEKGDDSSMMNVVGVSSLSKVRFAQNEEGNNNNMEKDKNDEENCAGLNVDNNYNPPRVQFVDDDSGDGSNNHANDEEIVKDGKSPRVSFVVDCVKKNVEVEGEQPINGDDDGKVMESHSPRVKFVDDNKDEEENKSMDAVDAQDTTTGMGNQENENTNVERECVETKEDDLVPNEKDA